MVEENINIETIENQGIDTEEKGLNQKNETILDSEVVEVCNKYLSKMEA